MSSNSSSSSNDVLGSAAMVLTIVFVVLKLTNVINWSWWWVLSPLWIGAVLGLVVLLIVLAIVGVATR